MAQIENKTEPAEPQAPRVTALIVSYNSVAALRLCVKAVDATPGVEVLVVDLGSLDGSARIDSEFPAVTVLRLPKHFGATKAMNIATRTSGADYIFYLDPHAVVDAGTVLGLADVLDSNADVIAAAPLLKPAPQVYRLPDSAALAVAAEAGSLATQDVPLTADLAPVEFASRSALMVRKDFIRGMNYFDERYGHAWPDLELAWQIHNAQRKTVVATRLTAQWHLPEEQPTGTTTVADRYNSAAAYLGKHHGFMAGIGFRLSAILKALFSFRFGLAQRLDWRPENRRDAIQFMSLERINLDEKFSLFAEHWRPKVIASLNGQELRIVKVKGEFPWHFHEKEDEFFLVWEGVFRVEFRDRIVELTKGEAVLVPRGVEHRTAADEEAQVLIFEPAEVRNTGNVQDSTYTAPQGDTI